ncbi:Cyclic nucleotide-gated cation channel beta-1 [Eumeta japonica]|uniref:Cyclic nucleotide-gated cation channel beta-1 n=1 Tax=Eumeta variegata TaxID=151549 RepID=A0A4C2AB09_EUMVA|nr:Cyclic nucleotide-gated cation channel beta-1 [Eumeta japonica]
MNRVLSAGSLDSDGQQFLRDQVRHLVRRFTARTNKMKTRLEMPPTPSSSLSSPSSSPPPPPPLHTKRTLANHSSQSPDGRSDRISPYQSPKKKTLFVADTPSNVWLCSGFCSSSNDQKTLDPQGKLYISWLCVVSISFLYNAWVIPLRSAFPFQTPANTNMWQNPKPEREGELVFMTVAWLMGVFVFALLIGQIRDIISTATRTKNEYRQLEDETLGT